MTDQSDAGAGFRVFVFSEDANIDALCRAYWTVDQDGRFVHTVQELAAQYQVPRGRVPTLVTDAARAYWPDETCTVCEVPDWILTRDAYQRALARRKAMAGHGVQPVVCRACRDAETRRQQEERQRAAEAAKYVQFNALQTLFEDRRAKNTLLVPPTLPFADAVYLLAVVRAGGAADLSHIVPHSHFALPLSPSVDCDLRILKRLYRERILSIHPGSSQDSVVGVENPEFSYYPLKVHWRLTFPESTVSNARWLESLQEMVTGDREQWPSHWHLGAALMHHVFAYEECLQYLTVCLEEHGFDPQPGEKLTLALRSILAHYSIGEAFNFIWRAARDTAAFLLRDECTSKAHALNTVPGRLQRMAERSRTERWAVKAYRRDRRVPESQVSHVLFTMALKLPDAGFSAVPPSSPDAAAADVF